MLAVLSGAIPDRVPLSIYDYLLPEGPTKEQLKRDGLTIGRWAA